MVDKSYIVITNAIRERLLSDPIDVTAEKQSYEYRIGDLGLIHPSIVDFYSNLEENMKKFTGKQNEIGEITSWGGVSSIPTSGLTFETYHHLSNNIPILLYHGNLLMGGESLFNKNIDYFMISLRRDEFAKIKGTDLNSVKECVKRIYNEHDRLSTFFNCNEETQKKAIGILEETIEEQWRYLEAFDILKSNKIHEVPMEVAQMRITNYEIEQRKTFLEKMDEADKLTAQSEAGLFMIIR